METNTNPASHVFAGKTTLADCLVASNGIISSRLAGKVGQWSYLKDRSVTLHVTAVLCNV